MGKYNFDPFCEFINNWSSKDFVLGIRLKIENNSCCGTYAIVINIGFWEIDLGFCK